MATQDHCNSKKIRPWILSSADESDRLPRQNREAPGRASHQSELEHDPKGRKNSGGRLTAENAEHTEWFLVFSLRTLRSLRQDICKLLICLLSLFHCPVIASRCSGYRAPCTS